MLPSYNRDEKISGILDPIKKDSLKYTNLQKKRADGRSVGHSYFRTTALSFGVFQATNGAFASTGEKLRSPLYLAPSEPNIQPTASERDQLVLEHRNEIGEKVSNILDIIRTRRETLSMITSNLKSIAKAAYFLKKGKWQKAKRALKVTDNKAPRGQDFPARWLELQYGWLPFLGDIYTLGTKPYREPVFEVRTTHWVNRNGQEVQSFDSFGYNYRCVYDFWHECRCTYVSKFKIKSATVQTLDALGVLNPTLVAWESIPFSFIVDWFLPIGDWLGTLTDLQGIELTDVSYTVRTTSTYYGDNTLRYRYGPVLQNQISIYQYTRKNRTASNALPFPLPRFKNPISLGHFANAFSLLAVTMKSRP